MRAGRTRWLLPRGRPQTARAPPSRSPNASRACRPSRTSPADNEPVPFFKRAQITASDLHLFGVAPAHDIDRLTLLADNLVPHVLRPDGVLSVDPGLVERIEHEQLIERGSREEVEIRACALHAVELLVASHGGTTAAFVDNALWDRGAGPRYKATPRHRARCTAY